MRLPVLGHLATLVLVTIVTCAPMDCDPDHSHSSSINLPADRWPPAAEPNSTLDLTLDPDARAHNSTLDKRVVKQRPPKGRQGAKKTSSNHQTTAAGGTSTTTRQSTALGGAIIVKALDDFDMMTEVKMAGKKATDTNTTPGPVMTSIMKDLEGVAASTSSPAPVKLPKLRIAHDNPRLKSAITLLEAAKAAKLQMDRPISGEVDLTQIITHGLAFPATEVLAAVSSSNSTSSPYWHGVGRGYAPIPDLQLQHGSNTLAVIEIKTTDSLDDIVADNIFAFFPTYTMGMLAEYTNGTGPMPALLRPVSLAKGKYHRYRRPHDVKIVEQLLAQMWSTGATIGAITNLKRWFIVQSFGDGVFEMTEVPGTVNGQSNAMNIMLAMSFQALGMK